MNRVLRTCLLFSCLLAGCKKEPPPPLTPADTSTASNAEGASAPSADTVGNSASEDVQPQEDVADLLEGDTANSESGQQGASTASSNASAPPLSASSEAAGGGGGSGQASTSSGESSSTASQSGDTSAASNSGSSTTPPAEIASLLGLKPNGGNTAGNLLQEAFKDPQVAARYASERLRTAESKKDAREAVAVALQGYNAAVRFRGDAACDQAAGRLVALMRRLDKRLGQKSNGSSVSDRPLEIR